MPGGLLTDLYELNMAASYMRREMSGRATFSLYVRRLPPRRRFLVAAGLESCLAYLENLSFDGEELEGLLRLGFPAETVAAFEDTSFAGDVWAVPEGRIVFPEEPLLEVTAALPEAQLVETLLLNQVTFQSAIASKAARCHIAAAGRIELIEFGFRRTHGVEAAMAAARSSAIVGFDATSNVEAALALGLRAAGTMAHSYISAFPTELEAFRAFAQDIPTGRTFLVDTYDTLGGVSDAIEVIKEFGLESLAAIRLDSGDLGALSREARTLLDAAGLSSVRIFLTGNLDEYAIDELLRSGAPFDGAGIGTRLGVSEDAPYLDTVYKLVDYRGRPVMKLSSGKETLPGAKQVFRAQGLRDVLGLRDEAAPAGTERLLVHVMSDGRRLTDAAGIASCREHFESDLASLPPALKELGETPPVGAGSSEGIELSATLKTLTEETRASAKKSQSRS